MVKFQCRPRRLPPQPSRRSRICMPTMAGCGLYGVALLSMLVLAGCVTTTQRAPSPWVRRGSIDPDAVRLQKIADALLLYFRDNKHLPATLSDLTPQPHGALLKLTNPETGRPYIFAPKALANNAISVWLLVYDAAPAHGRRWVILAQPPAAGRPVSMWVDHLTEAAFKKFNATAGGVANTTTAPATRPP